MSLVICSNQDADGSSERQKSNLFQPWSFKNQLTSTYNIPKDAQVALQSCKVNIDGRISVNSDNSLFYQYFGKKLNLDGVTSPQIEDTPYFPVLTSAVGLENAGQVKELSQEDFANSLQAGIRETTFHPNKKDQTTVEVLRNASNLDFLGYKITMDQDNANVAGIPADNSFEEFFSAGQVGETRFSYTGGVFTRTASVANGGADEVAFGICPDLPMNLCGGELTVNISGTSGRANASGVEWLVGLSRYLNGVNEDNYYYPPYAGYEHQVNDMIDLEQIDGFADFAICRNKNDELVLFHSVFVQHPDGVKRLTPESINYWENASSYFHGSGAPVDLAGQDYTDVKFEVKGERVSAEIYDNASSAWRVITEFNADEDFDNMFKPVPQTAWCLHPVLGVGVTDTAGVVTNGSCTLEITTFNDVSLSGYDPKTKYKGGWYESMELTGNIDLCRQVDSRTMLSSGNSEEYAQVGLNASDKVDLDNVLVVLPSDIYTPSPHANTKELIGFNKGVIDTPASEAALGTQIFQSTVVPDVVSSLSLFVRLDNFNQSVKNARVGNHSKILAHLTDLETKVGRQTYEPNNLVWLDLGNTNELNVNEFSLSFSYVNEQFATILTGQSIVCLYFRPKPKM